MSKMLAFSYLRMSTKEQLKGDSLDRQLETARKWAERNGYILDDKLRDIGVSAFKGKNRYKGALATFLELVRSGSLRGDVALIVEDIDRLSREPPLEAFNLFSEIVKAGVKLVTLFNNQEYTEASVNSQPGQLFMLLGAMDTAHRGSVVKSERVSLANAAKRRKGEPTSGTCPAWLTPVYADETHRKILEFVVIPEWADVVVRIYELAADGMGACSITALLNEEEVTTFVDGANKSNGWYTAYVNKILRWRAVVGEHQPCKMVDGERVPEGEPLMLYPPIIEPELFDRVQQQRKAKFVDGRPAGGRTGILANMFEGLCRCYACGGEVTMRQKGKPGQAVKPRYLVCDNAVRNNWKGARRFKHRGSYIRYEPLERAILNHVREFRLSELLADPRETEQLRHVRSQMAGVHQRIEKLKKAEAKWIAAFEDDDLDTDGIKERLRQITYEVRQAKQTRDGLKEHEAALLRRAADRSRVPDTIERLKLEMASAEGLALRAIRQKLATAMQTFIEFISFDPLTRNADVIVGGGIRAYRFRDGKLIDAIDLVPSVLRPDAPYPVEAFPGKRVEQVIASYEGNFLSSLLAERSG